MATGGQQSQWSEKSEDFLVSQPHSTINKMPQEGHCLYSDFQDSGTLTLSAGTHERKGLGVTSSQVKDNMIHHTASEFWED